MLTKPFLAILISLVSLLPLYRLSLSLSCFLSDGLFSQPLRCRLRLVSPHLKTLLSGRVKGYGTVVQLQSNFSCGRDEITVYLGSSCVRCLSLGGNYCCTLRWVLVKKRRETVSALSSTS
uniref:Uncharacterized protein n=1 Tax=Labrus bergylta TaxID=56723 RepID=A0A3Q3EQ61_9LABR